MVADRRDRHREHPRADADDAVPQSNRAVLDDDFSANRTLVEGGNWVWSPPKPTPTGTPEARCEELRWAEVAARMREHASKQASENLLSSLMPTTVVDEDGKVVAKSPGFLGDEDDSELALRHLVVQNERLRRQIDVRGSIEPARRLIRSEPPLDRRDLRPIVELTPLVPADRVDLVTTGFARFFGGDFFSALHILVPQLENILRHILKQAGAEPFAIQSDMTQESQTLTVMLTKERENLERILGPAIVFEIENLFDYRAGPALRHQLAHGLVSAGKCYDTDSIYACWFIFRLCCLPLFPHWNHVANRLDTPQGRSEQLWFGGCSGFRWVRETPWSMGAEFSYG